jgi:hypothetical protein
MVVCVGCGGNESSQDASHNDFRGKRSFLDALHRSRGISQSAILAQ